MVLATQKNIRSNLNQNEVNKWKLNDPLKIVENELDKKTIKNIRNVVKKYIFDETNKAILADQAE